MRRTVLALAILGALFLVGCSDHDSGDSAKLRIENKSGYEIIMHFGNWETKGDASPPSSPIATGGALDYDSAPVGKDFNIWYTYSVGTRPWIVKLVNSDSDQTIFTFNFEAGASYRLLLNANRTFEFYKGTTTIVGPGGGDPPVGPLVPSISSTTPANRATGISASLSQIIANFTESMNPDSVIGAYKVVDQDGTNIPGTVSLDAYNLSATFTLSGSPQYGTTYTATIAAGAESSAGVGLASDYSWSFTTSPPPAPMISARTTAGSVSVSVGSTVWENITVTMADSASGAEIRYTTDGEDPTSTSTLYQGPFLVQTSSTIKAAAFMHGTVRGEATTAQFKVYPPQVSGMGKISAMARTTGSIIYAVDYSAAKLYKVDAAARTIDVAAALPYANPTDIEYSSKDRILYICYRFKGVISRYDLDSGSFLPEYAFSSKSGDTAALSIELSDSTDRIFVQVPSSTSSYKCRIGILAKSDGAIKLEVPETDIGYGSFMAAMLDGSAIFLAENGSWLERYSRSATTDVLTRTHSIQAGGNGQALEISPDGSSLVFFCGGGNNSTGKPYDIADYSPSDFSIEGVWSLGVYPMCGVFSPDSTLFYTVWTDQPTTSRIYVYNRTSYQKTKELALPYMDSDHLLEVTSDGSHLVYFTEANDGTKNRLWFFSDIK